MGVRHNTAPLFRMTAPPNERPVVKSAGRVLQILEFFDDVRRPATASEIAAYFAFPPSSTSQLLRSMVAAGYLMLDRQTRRYSPSMRVSLLGNWCNETFVGEGPMLRMMRRLNERTGRAVFLAAQSGGHAQYIHVYQSPMPGRPHLSLGTKRPLSSCGAGIALLSVMDDTEATRIVLRNNADSGDETPKVSVRGVLGMLAEVRANGHVCFVDPLLSGGVLAAPLHPDEGSTPVAVCLGDLLMPMLEERERLTEIFVEELTRYRGTASSDRAIFEPAH